MHISRSKNNSNTDPSYHIENAKLASVQQIKYLGINIDYKLTFDAHIRDICRKASNNLHVLMRSLKRAKTRIELQHIKAYVVLIWSMPPLYGHLINRKWLQTVRRLDGVSKKTKI